MEEWRVTQNNVTPLLAQQVLKDFKMEYYTLTCTVTDGSGGRVTINDGVTLRGLLI